MTKSKLTMARCLVALALGMAIFAIGGASAEEFYQGKAIRFVVGFSPGGGYDTYTRTVARHIGKHIPGNPATVVENMTGAGSLIAANHIYNNAEPDALTVGVWNAQILFMDSMGDPSVRLDGRKLGWIGSPGKDTVACGIMGFAGAATMDDILRSRKELRMGATRGGNTVNLPQMLNRWAGANFKVIPGYAGTSKIRVAMQSREVDGACWTWESMRSTARSMLDAKGDDRFIPFVIAKRWEDPEVREIPEFREVFKDPEKAKAFDVWNAPNEFARPFSVPPGTPPDRLAILREAFKATLEDPHFLADAKRAKLTIELTPGEEIERRVKDVYSISAQMKEEMAFLVPKRRPGK